MRHPVILSCAHDVILYSNTMNDERKLKLKKAWLDLPPSACKRLGGKTPIFIGASVALTMHMDNGDRERYNLPKDRIGKIDGWDCDDKEPAHTAATSHFAFVPKVVYVQFFGKDNNPEAWTHPTLPGTRGVYPVKKKSCIVHVLCTCGTTRTSGLAASKLRLPLAGPRRSMSPRDAR